VLIVIIPGEPVILAPSDTTVNKFMNIKFCGATTPEYPARKITDGPAYHNHGVHECWLSPTLKDYGHRHGYHFVHQCFCGFMWTVDRFEGAINYVINHAY